MNCKVVSISRTLAAGAEEIGELVAEKLGFRYVDHEIIIAAAEKAGVSLETVERAEQTPGLIGRIVDKLGRAKLVPEAYAAWPAEPEYEQLIRLIVREAAARSNVVIVAHGASIELAGAEGLLRVLVTAPLEARAQRLASEGAMSSDKARKAIEESDKQRRDYLRRFYDLPAELPTHYDLVLNTERFSLANAAELIVAAAT